MGERKRRAVSILFLLRAIVIDPAVIGGPEISCLPYAFTDWYGYTAS